MEVILLRFSKAFLLSEVIFENDDDDDDGYDDDDDGFDDDHDDNTNADNVQMSFGSPLGVARATPSASPSS